MFCPNHNNRRTPCSQKIELKFGLSSEFSECFDKIPLRILLNVLFPVSRFSKACFNALTLSFIKFWNFVAILALRRMEGCHGNFVISHVKFQLMLKFPSKIRSNSSPNIIIKLFTFQCLIKDALWFKNDIFWHDKRTLHRGYYTVAQRYEFYFRVAKQYFTNERSEWVKYSFCHEKIKFISSSCCVMFFLLYRQKDIDKINREKLPKFGHR